MPATLRIALIGDHDPQVLAHQAIPRALELSAEQAGCTVEADWVGTATIGTDAGRQLASYAGLWCVPATPYASFDGALRAIRFAREEPRPFLGTCGGFQHAMIEFARNVLCHAQADHAESNPGAAVALITPLACPLVEQTGRIRLRDRSRLRAIYGCAEAVEGYHCSFGLDPRYAAWFDAGPLRVAAVDAVGETRAVELDGHPFFVATLFQPERAALQGRAHPLVTAFVRAAAQAG
jgi:CTP synthase (UTP-ammonia lyase)